LTFFTGASAKLQRGHLKRCAVALSVSGASRSRLCPGPRVHLIWPWQGVKYFRARSGNMFKDC